MQFLSVVTLRALHENLISYPLLTTLWLSWHFGIACPVVANATRYITDTSVNLCEHEIGNCRVCLHDQRCLEIYEHEIDQHGECYHTSSKMN